MFELGINLIEALIMVSFITHFLGAKFKGRKKFIGFGAVLAISFIYQTVINMLTTFEGAGVLALAAIYFVYALLCLNGTYLLKLFAAVINIIILVVASSATLLLFSLVLNRNIGSLITVFDIYRVIALITAKLLHFYVTRAILAHKQNGGASVKEYVLLIFVPIISVVSLSFLMVLAFERANANIHVLGATVGVVLTNIITYALFNIIQQKNQMEMEHRLTGQQYNNEIQNLRNMQVFYEETKALRHDLKEHFTALSALVQSGKGKEAADYIDKVLNASEPMRLGSVETENDIFNAVVNAKIAICSGLGIHAEVKVMKNSLASVADDDIGILFGNLLENAIRAAAESKEKRITLHIRLQGEYISIFEANTVKEPVLKRNGELVTTKKDKSLHGFGIKSIRRIVDKYEGMIEFFDDGNEFCCDILLAIHP
jgi:hypothetical protein